MAAIAAVEYLNDNDYQADDSHRLLRHWQILAASSVIALSLPMGQASCEASRVGYTSCLCPHTAYE